MAVAVVLAVVTAVAVVGVATRPGADHRTARPVSDLPPGVPKDLGRAAWSARLAGPVMVTGRYLVTAVVDGIEVREAGTGREHWHYRRSVLPVPPAHDDDRQNIRQTVPRFGVSADRRTVVTLWTPLGGPDILAGFDLASGELRWTREQQGRPSVAPAPQGLGPPGPDR